MDRLSGEPDLCSVVGLLCMIGPERSQIIVGLAPFLLLTLGALHLNDCPKEPMVPIYVIVGSSFFLTVQLFVLCGLIVLCIIPAVLIFIFLFCWLIAGSVFVYRAFEPNFESRHSDEYCDKTLYQAAFWCTNLAWLFVVVLGCCGMCAVVLRSDSHQSNQDDGERGEDHHQQTSPAPSSTSAPPALPSHDQEINSQPENTV